MKDERGRAPTGGKALRKKRTGDKKESGTPGSVARGNGKGRMFGQQEPWGLCVEGNSKTTTERMKKTPIVKKKRNA